MRVGLSLVQVALVLAGLVTAYLILPVHDEAVFSVAAATAAVIVLLVIVSGFATWAILHSDFPLLREVQSIAFVVSLATVGFAAIYASVYSTDAEAFSEPLDRVGALYLSVVTASTVGFGDIHAKSDAARIVVMLQILTSIGLVGVAIQMIRRAAGRRSSQVTERP